MISIIICSININNLQTVSRNIAETIGLPYELISVDNTVEKKSICSIYNWASQKAKFDYLCFLHDDLLIHTNNWGSILLNLFNISNIGLVGVSGTIYKSAYPSSWTACNKKYYRLNTIQHFENFDNPTIFQLNPELNSFSEVAVVDGVFLATRKSILSEYNFDEINLNGFHGYDFDLSMQIGQKWKVVVSHEILLEHYSAGKYNNDWISDTIYLHKKWKNNLPIFKNSSEQKDELSDYMAASSFLNHLVKNRHSNILIIKYYFILLIYFFPINKFTYTKSVLKLFFKK